MGGGEMQAEQEGILGLGIRLDGLYRPIAEKIGHVAMPLDRNLSFVQLARLRAAACRIAPMIEVVGGARINAEELVVAALQRAEIRQQAEMPFADQCSRVTR